MRAIDLPLSGWRFTLDRKPDGDMLIISKDSGIGPVTDTHPLSPAGVRGISVERHGPRWGRGGQVTLVWGVEEGTVQVIGLSLLGHERSITVHRLGTSVWIAEAGGRLRRLKIEASGAPRVYHLARRGPGRRPARPGRRDSTSTKRRISRGRCAS